MRVGAHLFARRSQPVVSPASLQKRIDLFLRRNLKARAAEYLLQSFVVVQECSVDRDLAFIVELRELLRVEVLKRMRARRLAVATRFEDLYVNVVLFFVLV